MTQHSAAGSWLSSPPPGVALQISASRLTAVVLATHGGRLVVPGHATEALPDGLVVPSLNAPNVQDERALAGVIASLVQGLGIRTKRVALVLPDSVAKVSLLRFEKVPPRAPDLEQLIRWQVRKAMPFRIEDAQVAWQPAAEVPGGGREFVVTVARRDIIAAYERACAAAGLHAGLVDISTFNQINAILAGPPITGDWLLIDVGPDAAILAVVRDEALMFYRHRSAAGEGELADLVHQTAMYHEDRLGGGGFTRVIVAGASVLGVPELEEFRRTLAGRIGVNVEPIDFRPAVDIADRIAAGPELLDLLAPGVGILVRERAGRRPSGRAAAAAGRVAS